MTKDQLEQIIAKVARQYMFPKEPPTEQDWEGLESRFSFKFPDEFKYFSEIICRYCLSGGYLSIGPGKGEDDIALVYDNEMEEGLWHDPNLIPFYSVGNGDYYCFNKTNSKIYFVYHDDCHNEQTHDSIEEWIIDTVNSEEPLSD